MIEVSNNKTGWDAWSGTLANEARARYQSRNSRLDREKRDNDERLAKKAANKLDALNAESTLSPEEEKERARKREIIAAAIARAQQRKS